MSRVWTDSNGNFSPDCDLYNSQPNGECQVWQDLGFGTARPTTFYDPAALTGWGNRPWNWEFSAGIQHELLPRLSVSAGYFRRVQGNFYVMDNEALTPADFTEYSVVVPTDARLPLSGQTITGVFDQNRSVVNRQVIKHASNFGNQYGHWDGFDVNFDYRAKEGLLLQGGVGAGKQMTDNCEIVDDVPGVAADADDVPDVATTRGHPAHAGPDSRRLCGRCRPTRSSSAISRRRCSSTSRAWRRTCCPTVFG